MINVFFCTKARVIFVCECQFPYLLMWYDLVDVWFSPLSCALLNHCPIVPCVCSQESQFTKSSGSRRGEGGSVLLHSLSVLALLFPWALVSAFHVCKFLWWIYQLTVGRIIVSLVTLKINLNPGVLKTHLPLAPNSSLPIRPEDSIQSHMTHPPCLLDHLSGLLHYIPQYCIILSYATTLILWCMLQWCPLFM